MQCNDVSLFGRLLSGAFLGIIGLEAGALYVVTGEGALSRKSDRVTKIPRETSTNPSVNSGEG